MCAMYSRQRMRTVDWQVARCCPVEADSVQQTRRRYDGYTYLDIGVGDAGGGGSPKKSGKNIFRAKIM